MLRIGHHLQKGVAKERLIEGQAMNDVTQGVAIAICRDDKVANEGRVVATNKSLASDIIGLVVEYSAVCHRAS